jgi:fermentation-respiration switch protein FrsA (DUF1100 family)
MIPRCTPLAVSTALASVLALSGCAAGKLSPLAPLERSLVYYPEPFPKGNWEPWYLPREDAWFAAEDGTKLHGWFVDHPQPQAIALFMHGNAGNVTMLAQSLAVLNHRHRLAIMTFDYRGYGRSEGSPSEEGILQDARAARRWLAERKGVSEDEIVLMGVSLGGAVAVDLAANDGARGLVLASTFTSLPDVGSHHVPWLPTKLLMTERLNSLHKIGRYYGPLLYSHGDADSVVPYELGVQLYEAAPGPKRFIRIAGGEHLDPMPEHYRKALEDFLQSLPR